MPKWKKIALFAALAVVVVITVLAIVIPMLFDVDRYRPQVAAELQEKTGKPAQIGHLSLTVFPQVAIRIDNLSLQNPTGFPAGDFVTAKKIYAVVNASALMHHQVEITSLQLDDLTLNLLEDTHGKWNFENPPVPAETANNQAGVNSSAAFTLGVISKLTVSRGQLTAASLLESGIPGPALVEVHGATIDVHDVNLSAFTQASLQQNGPASNVFARLAGLLDTTVYADDGPGPTVAQGKFKADALQFGDLNLTKVKSDIRLYPKEVFADNLEMKCYSGSLTGNLSLNFGAPQLGYSLDTTLKGINVAELLTAFPQAKGMMTGTLEGTASLKGMVTHSSNPLEGIVGSGQAAVHNGEMPSLQLNENLRSLTRIASIGPANGDPSSFSLLSSDFDISNGRLISKKLSLVGNGLDVDGSGDMSMAGPGSLDYQGDAGLAADDKNPLTNVLAGLSGGKVADGKITFPFTVAGTFAKPKFSLKGVAGQNGSSSNMQQNVDMIRGLSSLFKKKKQQ